MDGLIVGRIVHYVLDDGAHAAAIVVEVRDKDTGAVSLHVFLNKAEAEKHRTRVETGAYADKALYNPNGVARTWHWIEGSRL